MKRRCDASPYYKTITVCDRWRSSFENFLVDMGERPDGMTIERKDNTKGYEPSNCTWASRRDQVRNRKNQKLAFNDAVEINIRRMKGERFQSIADRFDITTGQASHICSGHIWADAKVKAVAMWKKHNSGG